MAQCEKILDNGERCSNQAVPGARFCRAHRRILFRPVEETADTAPPPPEEPERPAAEWRAEACPAGRSPRFPGLAVDGRGILAGPEGIVWLPAGPEQFNRLVRLLSFLSQATPLPGQVRLLHRKEGGDSLVWLSPVEGQHPHRSIFYDIAAAAARLVDGRVYVGRGRHFIQYRDDAGPHGYDAPDFKADGSEESLLLVARWGSRRFDLADFEERPLAELARRLSPQPAATGPLPERLYALAPSPLYPLLARYFRAHHLRYGLTRLQASSGELLLFEIAPRPEAPAGPVVPRFILDYLSRLPRLALLRTAYQAGQQRLLLQWGHRYPLRLDHLAGAFGPEDMILLIAEPYPNLKISPAPPFFDGDQLMAVHAPRPQAVEMAPQSAAGVPDLKLPVLLRADPGPSPPIAALILSAQELIWLRQLLYRLPGEALGAYSLCQGRDQAVLLGGERPIEGIPFGTPLRRLSDSELFIPLRSRFAPDLPWPLLRQAVEIEPEVYTFITADYRLDLPADWFHPLSRALVAEPGRPRVAFTLRPTSALPDLRWSRPEPVETKAEPQPDRPAETPPVKEGGWLGRLAQSFTGGGQPAGSDRPPVSTGDIEAGQVEAYLREQAVAYEAAGDFLAAALCYDFISDAGNSARCFQQAVAAVQEAA